MQYIKASFQSTCYYSRNTMNKWTLILLGLLCSLIYALGQVTTNDESLEKFRSVKDTGHHIKLYEEKNISAMAAGENSIFPLLNAVHYFNQFQV
jgi:hypothetical protein